jgi:hypothetical protein
MFRLIVAVLFTILAAYSWFFDSNLKDKYRDSDSVRPPAVQPQK